ncbi:ArnT family glycosyltransferase [Paenirhodobacter populi]|uniref:Glycosyl transferase n=1 Tax=Paenirhodobacter populi TaxID=2306993 RepID=A0A443IZZ6_9RHOB|nr:glycosyltransferase family 39 protein [Sinirhodobacter populi]RWR13692.1 glycosyl transferase [Sinirhodobacter populi]
MRTDASDTGWLRPALFVVLAVTVFRLVMLAFDRTDLFVDETQYWLWGQRLDFGYYSKPPLIGWVIGLVTRLASDAPFWVRMPGTLFHAATALILAALAARIAGRAAAIWTAALYVTLPFVGVGTVMISTDTIMAPFFALALLFFWRCGEDRRPVFALAAGAAIGAAFMAKYAAIYFLIGAGLAMIAVPGRRIGWGNAALMVLAFAVVISPNVVWNLTHKLATVEHTMDNVGWVRGGAGLNFGSMAEFFGSQFGVFGPVAMVALLVGYFRRGADARALALLSVPPLIAVTVQALLGKAYANWAVAAYFAGTVLAVLVLPRWGRWLALAFNLIVTVTIPVLTVLAPWPVVNGKPLLNRYLGREELSTRILALAQADGVPVYADDRDILADLFYTGRNSGVTIYAPRNEGRPRNYYEQTFPLPEGFDGRILVLRREPLDCGAGAMPPAGILATSGVWSDRQIIPYVVDGGCLAARP